jgi:6-phosphogluconolactonase
VILVAIRCGECFLGRMKRLRGGVWRIRVGLGGAVALALMGLPGTAKAAQHPGMRIYIGTYTREQGRGIYTARFNSQDGRLDSLELAAETKNPSFLALHPRQPWLYAVGEMSGDGAVTAFRIEDSGKLTLVNQQSSGGAGPCHVAVDHDGRCVLVANYASGRIASLPIGKDGRLEAPVSVIQHQGSSVNPQRQAGPHAHFILPDPRNRFVLACDLGLDKVLVYRLDARACTLAPNDPPSASVKAGSGPRHLTFSPGAGRFVYVINELSSTLNACGYDAERGVLKKLQTTSTLPKGFEGRNTCAEVQIHPGGRFVYGSNRGHDSIAIFAVNPADGTLKCVGHQLTGGQEPRHFAVDPSGKWLLAENQNSGTVVVFRIDPETGRLEASGHTIEVPSPVCVVFAPGR